MGAAASTSYVTDPQTLADEEFDYIIVGSGPAGCVLANRLSQNPNIKVLLVEAGGNNEDVLESKIPLTWTKLLRTPSDWAYETTPQSTLNDRELFWPRGKLLGGSTSINAMMYQHAPPDDLDEFERLGATGWNARAMEPYFRKTEKFTPSTHHVATTFEHRGDSGVWNTGYTVAHPMTDRFVEAASKAGIPAIHEHNTPKGPNGVSHMMTFIDKKGARSSAATSYLPSSVRARPNLRIALNTRCAKVNLSPSADGPLKCTGAEFATSASGPRTTIKAKKEVILCAGAIGTPQILICSGVGPKEELRKAGVEVKLENEHVGQHLVDHLAAFCTFRAKDSCDWLAHPIKSLPYLVQWLLFGTGPLTTNAGEAAAFIRLDQTKALWESKVSRLPEPVTDTTSGPNAPDIEIIGAPLTFSRHGTIPAPAGTKGYTIGPILLRPLSAGYIGVKTGNVFDTAVIEPNYFADRTDIENLIRGVRVVLKIAHTSPLAEQLIFDLGTKSNKKVDDPVSKEPEDDINTSVHWICDRDPDELTDEVLEKWLRGNVETLYHPVCTARIAHSADEGVVDAQLRVFGVEGLRIADASVFPKQIAAHPTATIIAMGEMISDIILGEK